MDEIGDWSKMSPEERAAIMVALPERESLVKPKRRRGRASKTGKRRG